MVYERNDGLEREREEGDREKMVNGSGNDAWKNWWYGKRKERG